jgi:20S proteasome alpha/beta subunit
VTIAVAIKVNDGIVLASDSATTLSIPNGQVANVYNHANKVFNLHKGLPIGAMTWGTGAIGPASIATLAKDVRRRFQPEPVRHAWALDPMNYQIEDVAVRVHDFLVTEKFDPTFGPLGSPSRPYLGFLVAGYSNDADEPHLYVMDIGPGPDAPVEVLGVPEGGIQSWGQPEAINRIMNGFSLDTAQAIVNLNVGLDKAGADQFVQDLQQQVGAQLVHSAMPIQDAIELAEFLVHATIQFVRFKPGDATVGGPIEIATITKHEGFKWVRRKHYYDPRLNPGGIA